MNIHGMPKKASSSVPKWQYSSSVTTKMLNNFNPICQATQQSTLKGKFVITHNHSKSISGKLISVQIYSGTEVDPGKVVCKERKYKEKLESKSSKIE